MKKNHNPQIPGYTYLAAAIALSIASAGTAFAAEDREPIEEIRLVFQSEIETGGSSSEVEVTTEDDGYTVGGVEVLNASGDWAGGVRPRVEVVLYADDDYYFPRIQEDMFHFHGEDVEYISAKRQEDNSELVLTVRLEELEEEHLWVDGLRWDKDEGLAVWEENPSVRGYEARLYRGSTLVDSTVFRSSSDTVWAVSGKTRESGTYYFQVRAVGSGSSRGEWETSGRWTRSGSGTSTWDDNTTTASDKEMVSPSTSTKPQEGYYSDEVFDPDKDYGGDDWDYDWNSRTDEDEDGGPGASQSRGTTDTPGNSATSGSSAASSGSVTAGSSATGGTRSTPGTDAAAIGTWPDPVRTDTAAWKQDQQGWWLQLQDGTWLSNTWAMVDNTWYCFDPSGYLRYGWILSNGSWYYCGEGGGMLVNARTPDGHFVGGDGVWIQ